MYCLLKLNKRRQGKRRLPNRSPEPLVVPPAANCNREAPAIEVDLNLPAPRVIRVLGRVALFRGYPEKLRVDNGPEFVSLALADWAEEHDVALDFIQPGKPTQNSFIERFKRTYRDELLDFICFGLSEKSVK